MTTFDSAMAHRGSKETGFTTKRRQAGTSLVEILVVIVIFLIGILAVVQVFPRGFRLLLVSRNNSVATALGRDEIERLKANPAALPEEVLPVRYVGSTPVVDPTDDPLNLGPRGDALSVAGVLSRGGTAVGPDGDWQHYTGPNGARHIVGEGARVPAPRSVGSYYGGLMVLEHGPIDPGPNASSPNILAYANDLSRTYGPPLEAKSTTTYSVVAHPTPTTNASFNGALIDTPATLAPFEFFVVDSGTPAASIFVPLAPFDRTYRLRVSAYVGSGSSYARRDYLALSFTVPAAPTSTVEKLVHVPLASLLAALGQIDNTSTFLGSIEPDTARLAPQYVSPPSSGWTAGNPFEAVVLDPSLGVLVFNPAAREGVVTRPGGASEPLVAKVDYDVLDWRILREDFRMLDASPIQLAVQSLKVGTQNGPDGLPNGGLFGKTANALDKLASPSDQNEIDNVVIEDLTTGGTVAENPATVKVDKSRGTVSFLDKVSISVPQGAGKAAATLSGIDMSQRTIRVLYRARDEWAVQLLKSASNYAQVRSFPAANQFIGQYYVGDNASGTTPNKIYFPRADAGRKVTIDRLLYQDSSGVIHTLEGQDFVIHAAGPTDVPNYAYVSLADVVADPDPTYPRFVTSRQGQAVDPVRGVKAASAMVRVLWNPDAFSLTSDPTENMNRLDQWGRGWRRSTTETYLRAEETR